MEKDSPKIQPEEQSVLALTAAITRPLVQTAASLLGSIEFPVRHRLYSLIQSEFELRNETILQDQVLSEEVPDRRWR